MRDRKLRHATLSIIGFTLFSIGFLTWLLGNGDALPKLGKDPYRLQIAVPNSASLTQGARVTMAGVKVGKVERVERSGSGALVEVIIDDERVTPLPQGSRARLRMRTAVGENYLSIEPGRAEGTIPTGGLLPADQTDEYVELDQVLSALQGKGGEGARKTLRSLGSALAGRGGQLQQLVHHGAHAAAAGGRLVDTLHEDRVAASRLIDQLGTVAAAIGERDAAIQKLAKQGLVGLEAIREHDEALAATLRELPPSMERVRRLSGTVASTARHVTPVARDASVALRAVRPAVDRLPRVTGSARAMVSELGVAAPRLERTVQHLSKASERLPNALPPLRDTLCDLSPMLEYLEPYGKELISIVTGLGSASNSYDATGHLIRLVPILGANSVAGLSEEVLRAEQTLLHGGLLQELMPLNYAPYPPPGSVGRIRATSNVPIGPEEVPKTGYRYPRIQPAC